MNAKMNKHVWNGDLGYKDREGENPAETASCMKSCVKCHSWA